MAAGAPAGRKSRHRNWRICFLISNSYHFRFPPLRRRSHERHRLQAEHRGTVSQALVPAGDERLDRDKRDDLARRINEASRGAALDLAYAVGRLIIEELYEGSLGTW